MYDGWTEYVVLLTNYLGFIWDMQNVSTYVSKLNLDSWYLIICIQI